MADYAIPGEKFVEIPGVVEIRWVSDDPDTYVEPVDLFEEQATEHYNTHGLDNDYGKKDKATTEQAYFTCNLCECDLKAIKTLRDHCKGQKHVKKALQKKMQLRKLEGSKGKEESQGSVSKRPKLRMRTLFQELESTSEAVVGLEFITEFTTGDERDDPLYHCSMEHCLEEQGDAETMKTHILTLRHKQSYVYCQTGCYLTTQTETQQKVAELTSDYRRDYRKIKVQEDREAHRKIKDGRFKISKHKPDGNRNDRSRSRSRSRERTNRDEERKYGDQQRDRKYEESGRREDKYSRRSYQDEHDRRGEGRSYDSGRRGGGGGRDRNYQDQEESYRGGRRDGERSQDGGRGRERREWEPKIERGGGGAGGWDRKRSPEVARPDQERSYRGGRRDGERSRDSGERERSQREPKVERSPPQQSRNVLRSREEAETVVCSEAEVTSTVTTLEEEEVARLHKRVAQAVMTRMNKYWPGAAEFVPGNQKIRTAEDYSRLAKQLSRDLREKIKESYRLYHRDSLEGIKFTLDHDESIYINVESFFEKLPLV